MQNRGGYVGDRRELLLLVNKGAMPRGTKGYPVRKLVLEKFAGDIKALYSKVASSHEQPAGPRSKL